MFSDSVAQKPTMPVSAPTKNGQNVPALAPFGPKADGWASIGPNPPALSYAQYSSSNPSAISSGALMFSRMRIELIPRQITATLISQKIRNETNCGIVIPSSRACDGSASDGQKTDAIL